MKMKKLLFILTVSVLCCIIVTGCGDKKNNAKSENETGVNFGQKSEETVSGTDKAEGSEQKSEEDMSGTPEGTDKDEGNTKQDESAESKEKSKNDTAEENEIKTGTIKMFKIDSECIKQNLIGENSERKIYIYLPKSYSDDGTPLPVVYFLHGLDDSSATFALQTKTELDAAFDGSVKEFIVVILDGNNSTGGSFYVNSPASGNWEDFITKELVSYVDSNYNTIPESKARCITGYSMGGYGAINIGFNNTDVFSSLLVFCPGVYADGCIREMWDSWTGWSEVKRSYAQAFSPNEDSEQYFGNIPEFSGTEEDNAVLAEWDLGYGSWTQKVAAYAAEGAGLDGIQIAYGKSDSFLWIPKGCIFLAEKLKKNGIGYELTEFPGGHVVPSQSYKNYFIPFTEKYLKFNN